MYNLLWEKGTSILAPNGEQDHWAEPYNPRSLSTNTKGRLPGYSATNCCVVVNGQWVAQRLIALCLSSLPEGQQ